MFGYLDSCHPVIGITMPKNSSVLHRRRELAFRNAVERLQMSARAGVSQNK